MHFRFGNPIDRNEGSHLPPAMIINIRLQITEYRQYIRLNVYNS